MAQRSPVYRRILLKLSGEALLGGQQYGIDPAVIRRVAAEVKEVVGLGVQVGLVIGGGNIFRGAGLAEAGMDRVTADQMGMLATVINSRARAPGYRCTRDVGVANPSGLRGLHPAPRRASPRERARHGLRGRNR
jgi:hypothetical protein